MKSHGFTHEGMVSHQEWWFYHEKYMAFTMTEKSGWWPPFSKH
jgi:hypothetical protein